MADSGKPSGDWKSERISMTHLANFSRSSSYVRSLVRQQFHHQSDQPATAWERLRGRLAEKSSFDYDEEIPSFMKKRERGGHISDDENTSDNEDEDDEEETYVYLKSANPNHRSSAKTVVGKQNVETVSTSNESASSLSSRRLSAPPSSSNDTEKQYTLPSTDAHSKILNRRLSLAENVIRNYSKYIRTPDESQAEGERAKSEREAGNKQPVIVAISEEESSPFVDIKLVNRAISASSHSTDFLPNPDLDPGSSYTEPPTPADESDTMFFDVPVRRNSLNDVISEDFSLTRSRTLVTPVSTKAKLASDAKKLPRLSQTSKTKSKTKNVSAKSRDEAIEMLRGDHEKLKKNRRLNRRIGRETVYQQLLRDQQRRARESAIFIQEMEQITATLKAINTRLDERMKVLDCADPPKVNARLQRILQVALAGVPSKNI